MIGTLFARETGRELASRRLVLRAPQLTDYPRWRDVRAASRAFLTPYEPTWAHDELSQSAFKSRLRHYARDASQRAGYTFFLFLEHSGGPLVGGVTLSNIRRRVAQAVTLGYWMAEDQAGKGLMTEAVDRLKPFVFEDLALHRLEAACLPHNNASIRVLEKCGFRREGLAEGYLMINGKWRDHLLYGLNHEQYLGPGRSA